MVKKRMYSFMEKKHSMRGFVSTILGGVSLLIFLILVYIAFCSHGEGGTFLGVVGIAGFLSSLIGLFMGMISFGEKNTLYLFSKIGSILNSCVFAIWMFVILIGVG